MRNEEPLKESVIVRKILQYLKTIPACFAWKEHGGMYGTAGIPDPECKPHPGRMEDSGEIIKSLQVRYMTPTGNFEQKNRARSLDKALTKALLLFSCKLSLVDLEPVVND